MCRKLVLFFVASAILVFPAVAQTFGEISGLITDTTGAVMSGVSISDIGNFGRIYNTRPGLDMRKLQFSL